jgi:PKD repeat protein
MDSKRKFLALSLVCAILFSVAPVLATTVADNGSGNSTNKNNTVSLPSVNFTANVTHGMAPLNVLYTSNCTGNPTEFNWTFGDGTNSMQNLTAIHTYIQPGKYNVSLTVSNAAGNKTSTKLGYIVVSKKVYTNNKVLCSGKAPLRVMYLDRSKKHISSHWDFGDGQTSNSKNILHIYKKPGKYPVKLSYKTIGHVNKTLYAGYIVVK